MHILDYQNKISYADEFKIINYDLYNKLKKYLNINIYLSKKEYLINKGTLIIKCEYSSKNIYELLIGNYNIQKDKFISQKLFYYYTKEEMILNFTILSKIEYSKFIIKYIYEDKKHQYLIKDKDNTKQKIGIIFNLNENHSLKEKETNYFRTNINTEKKNVINSKFRDENNNFFKDNNNIKTEIEVKIPEKYLKLEESDSKINRYEIEFDSYSFSTTLPIPKLSCINCKSEIELVDIYFNKNNEDDILVFNCLGNCDKIEISIKEYLQKFILNTYLYEICYSCKKIQINDTDFIFNYCLECLKIYCEQCFNNHECSKYNNFIKINNINSKCLIHKNKDLNSYCYEDKRKLCQECLNDGSHLNHTFKLLLSEILPIKIDNKDLEIEIFQNIMDYFKQKIRDINENKKLNIKNKFQRNKNNVKEKYDNINNNLKSEKYEKINKIKEIYKNKKDKLEILYNNKILDEKNNIFEELNDLMKNLDYL